MPTKPTFAIALRPKLGLWVVAVIGLLSINLAGCVPTANYEEPLSQIGRGAPPTPPGQFKNLTLGVILTKNSIKAMGVVTSCRHEAGLLLNPGIYDDCDWWFLQNAIAQSLKRRFKDVIELPNFGAKRTASAEVAMYLDIQVTVARTWQDKTSVAVQGIFVDDSQAPIAQIKGNASVPPSIKTLLSTVAGFKPAASQAVEQFAEALDANTELADKLGSSSLTIAQASPAPVLKRPAPAARSAPGGERRVALVVGNSGDKYVPHLNNPRNDAHLMAETLRRLGFTLVGGKAQIDLNKPAFDRAIQEFGSQLGDSSAALFYYAGHGIQAHEKNFLIPVSANPTKESDAAFQLLIVDAQLVLNEMEDGGARMNIMILDACRNNPFGGRGLRSAGGGLAQMQAPKGTLISYATQPGQVASDGAGQDSPYTIALVQAIQEPGLNVLDVFNKVGLLVEQETGDAQQPWISSSPIEGEFHFVKK